MIHRCITCGVMITSYAKTGRCNKHRLSPEQIEQLRERTKASKPWRLLTLERRADPVMRAKIAKGVSEARLAWCPPYLRAEYLALAVSKLSAAERRRIILDQHERNLARGAAA